MPSDNPTMRRPAIPVPKGGFTTNQEEARWLADTIQARAEETVATIGLSVSMKAKDDGLYTLILMALEQATGRGRKSMPPQLETTPAQTLFALCAQQNEHITAHRTEVARAVEKRTAVARAICRERCSFMGEPACFDVSDDQGNPLPWPAPNCDDPGCEALALAAIGAMEEIDDVAS